MSVKKTVLSFGTQFKAYLKGDTDIVLEERVYRQSKAEVTARFHIETGKLVQKELAIEKAKDEVTACRVNRAQLISDGTNYVDTLIRAKEVVLDKEEELEVHKLLIASLEEEMSL